MSIDKLISEVFADFIKGQSDCKNGVPHQSGKGEDYDRGYSTQYQLEQLEGSKCR